MDPRKQLRVLRDDWQACQRCDLGKKRHGNIVFGTGSVTADFLFVYDVPTPEDVECASPMSGEFGDILVDDLLKTAGIDNKRCYVTPLLGCRPTVLLPATDEQPERLADRAPEKKELETCRTRLEEIIYIVDPKLIFTMGDLAWKMMVKGKDRGISTSLDKAVGKHQIARIPGRIGFDLEYPVIPLLSIKQIVAQPSAAKHGPLSTTVQHLKKGLSCVDFVKATDKVNEP